MDLYDELLGVIDALSEHGVEYALCGGVTVEGGRILLRPGRPEEQLVYRISKISGNDMLSLDLVLVGPALRDVWDDRRAALWKNRRVGIVSRQGIAKMKRPAGRRQDLLDLEKLGLEDDREETDDRD